MAPKSSFATQLPYLFMTVFFGYATYVQLNDPDKYLWIAIYGVAALGGLCATLGVRSLASLLAVASAAAAAVFLSSRILYPPSCEMGENVVSIGAHKLSLDVNTENGRENAGLLIVLSWNLIAAVATAGASLSAGAALVLLSVAGAILASAVLVPAYVMSPDKLQDYPHCSGLGITPERIVETVQAAAAGAAAEHSAE